jgi:hypothetical protein
VDDRTKAALDTFTSRLVDVPEVEAVWDAGSLATADYVPGVSDLDLVAVTRAGVAEGTDARPTSRREGDLSALPVGVPRLA